MLVTEGKHILFSIILRNKDSNFDAHLKSHFSSEKKLRGNVHITKIEHTLNKLSNIGVEIDLNILLKGISIFFSNSDFFLCICNY